MISPKENFSGITDRKVIYLKIEQFNHLVVVGRIKDVDGDGYYANADKISSVKVVLSEIIQDHYDPPAPDRPRQRSRMADGTHVAWFPNNSK